MLDGYKRSRQDRVEGSEVGLDRYSLKTMISQTRIKKGSVRSAAEGTCMSRETVFAIGMKYNASPF